MHLHEVSTSHPSLVIAVCVDISNQPSPPKLHHCWGGTRALHEGDGKSEREKETSGFHFSIPTPGTLSELRVTQFSVGGSCWCLGKQICLKNLPACRPLSVAWCHANLHFFSRVTVFKRSYSVIGNVCNFFVRRQQIFTQSNPVYLKWSFHGSLLLNMFPVSCNFIIQLL